MTKFRIPDHWQDDTAAMSGKRLGIVGYRPAFNKTDWVAIAFTAGIWLMLAAIVVAAHMS